MNNYHKMLHDLFSVRRRDSTFTDKKVCIDTICRQQARLFDMLTTNCTLGPGSAFIPTDRQYSYNTYSLLASSVGSQHLLINTSYSIYETSEGLEVSGGSDDR